MNQVLKVVVQALIFTFSMALLRRPVILLQTLAARALEPSGSSEMTVLRPMLDISLSCSLSETIFPHRASTIVSTWYSLTLFTRGPRLRNKTGLILDGRCCACAKIFTGIYFSHHFTARFCTSPFLSSSNFNSIFTTFRSESSSSFILSFCSSVIRSFVAMNLKSLSLDVI